MTQDQINNESLLQNLEKNFQSLMDQNLIKSFVMKPDGSFIVYPNLVLPTPKWMECPLHGGTDCSCG